MSKQATYHVSILLPLTRTLRQPMLRALGLRKNDVAGRRDMGGSRRWLCSARSVVRCRRNQNEARLWQKRSITLTVLVPCSGPHPLMSHVNNFSMLVQKRHSLPGLHSKKALKSAQDGVLRALHGRKTGILSDGAATQNRRLKRHRVVLSHLVTCTTTQQSLVCAKRP